MRKIVLLTDYNDRFGSKAGDKPYRSGMDHHLLIKLFNEEGFEAIYYRLADVQNFKDIKEIPILYTSSEDPGYKYRSYVEDVVLLLTNRGAKVIPRYEFLRANNNKSFMELFRKTFENESINTLKSWSFGTLEELLSQIDEFNFPVVIKNAEGAMSRGVFLANNKKELINLSKKISRSIYLYQDIKDFFRPIKHTGYTRQSVYRKKFVIQQYIPYLKNDWKALVYFDEVFVLNRGIRKNDFRASGSKFNYLAGSKTELPDGFLDFAISARKILNVPNVSLDIVFDGKNFHLVEFQALYFGTSTINMSDVYYRKNSDLWSTNKINNSVEYYFVKSIVKYLANN